jgi:predicted nucleic acid-binding protein
MRLIVDTTEIFSFFNKKSKARELSLLSKLELHSPLFALTEIKEHKSEILNRFSLSETQFLLIWKLLNVVVKFADEKEYSKFMIEAESISPDPDDSDFFALALKHNCVIWSEDKELKRQDKVKILSTSDLIKELRL